MPRERERIVSAEHTEVRFLINQELKEKLDEVRALLGPRGAQLNLSELVSEMASLSTERLSEKRFGKKRVSSEADKPKDALSNSNADSDVGVVEPPQRISRHIPHAIKHEVWQQSGGRCSCCGSRQRLQFDHRQPFALGGDSRAENIRLLCQSCNLRRGVKTFGAAAMKRA